MEGSAQRRAAVCAYAAMRAGAALEPYAYASPELGAMDVDIEISHSGICHSDLHLIDNDWGVSSYPLVPGHEIVGTVSRVGTAVAELREGQRVGVGWLAGACLECAQCRRGEENLCRQAQPTCVGREGGYATRIRVDSRFAVVIPDSLSSEAAAPLLCAGITVFAPLRRAALKTEAFLGVIGIGGLGHLAIQYGKAMGCRVIAFSGSAAKAAEAQRFGAERFVVTSKRGALDAEAGSCDFLLSTVPADLPWTAYLNLLKPNGSLCIVGASPGEFKVPVVALIDGQKNVGGSAVGSNAEMRAMLKFSAEHNIAPMVELFEMKDVNRALDRLRGNHLRYRAVLTNRI